MCLELWKQYFSFFLGGGACTACIRGSTQNANSCFVLIKLEFKRLFEGDVA